MIYHHEVVRAVARARIDRLLAEAAAARTAKAAKAARAASARAASARAADTDLTPASGRPRPTVRGWLRSRRRATHPVPRPRRSTLD